MDKQERGMERWKQTLVLCKRIWNSWNKHRDFSKKVQARFGGNERSATENSAQLRTQAGWSEQRPEQDFGVCQKRGLISAHLRTTTSGLRRNARAEHEFGEKA
jgi:hypothetical protein